MRLSTEGFHAKWRGQEFYMCLSCVQEQTDAERYLECQCTDSVSVVSHCPFSFTHLSDTETNHHTPWRALCFISVTRDIFAKHWSRSILPSPSTPSKWPLFTGATSNILCVLSSLPMQATICGSILVVSYLNCIYNMFLLHCLKFSPVHPS
jgi:hypothetical protein